MHASWQLTLIRLYFYFVSRLFPSLSVKSAHRLFHYPVNTKRKNRHAAPLPRPEKFTIPLYDTLTLQGYRWGKKNDPKVLLVHGWSTTSKSMSRFTQSLLQNGYQVLSYDALRHGESKGSFTADLASWADSVHAALKEIGDVECIIAHSFGAAAVTVASKLGLKTKKLVLVAPIHDISSVSDSFAVHFGIPPDIVRKMRDYTWEQNKTHFSKYGNNWHDILESHFHVPTLILHDIQDKEIGIEHSKALCKLWPWATLVTTRGLGHRTILDDEGVAKDIIDFLKNDPQ